MIKGPILGGPRRLIVVVNLIMPVSGLDIALRAVRIGGCERRPDVFESDAVFVKCVRIEFDPHRRQRAAADDDLADPLDLRQFLRHHRGRRVIKVALELGIGGQGQDENGASAGLTFR